LDDIIPALLARGEFSADLEGGGRIETRTEAGERVIVATNVPLAPFSTYVEHARSLAIEAGTGDIHATCEATPGGGLRLHILIEVVGLRMAPSLEGPQA